MIVLKRAAITVGLFSATLAIVLPIWKYGSPIGHDSRYHLLWATEFIESLSSGILYPRWLPDVNAGLGSPTFIFYSPLFYYVTALFWPLIGSVPRALDLATTAALLASGVAAYRYLRNGLGRGPAFLGALAMMALPYRVADLYQRSAYPEFMAFVWPPLAFMALWAIVNASTAQTVRLAAACLAAVTAGLAVTHLLSLMIWGPVFALAGAVTGRPGRRIATLCRSWLALAAGLGLAAVYLLPAYLERAFVRIEDLYWAKPENHTLFSTALTGKELFALFNATVSRIACWEAVLVAVAAAAALWPGGGRPWWRADPQASLKEVATSRLPVFGATVLAACAFAFMLPWSAPVWRHLPLLPTIQFPWRLLAIVTVAAALLVACAAARLADSRAPVVARGLAAAALLLFAANLLVSWLDILAPSTLDSVEAARRAADRERQDVTEYLPRDAFRRPKGDEPALHVPRATTLAPGGKVDVAAWEPTRRMLVVRTPQASRLRVGTFFYTGWRATVDGESVPIIVGPYGVIEIGVPAGQHLVEVRFESTLLRQAGLALSLTSGLALVAWVMAAV
jgi:uncharacterized membrane protein